MENNPLNAPIKFKELAIVVTQRKIERRGGGGGGGIVCVVLPAICIMLSSREHEDSFDCYETKRRESA